MTTATLHQLSNGTIEPQLLDTIGHELEITESMLMDYTRSATDLITQVGQHTLKAGGKRLRPAFLITSALALGQNVDKDRVRKFACVMEMIHMASLIHDDVIDQSPLRRGLPTAHQLFGVTESVLSGDVLLARAMQIMAEDGDVETTRTVAAAVSEVTEGEVRELAARGNFDLTEAECYSILEAKTASFIRACCEAGAKIANGNESQVNALRTYGEKIGLAFQIVDDLLDYRGNGHETGKPLAIDFRDGQATLPLIRLKPKLSESEHQVLRLKFGNGVNDDEIRMISGWMESRGAFKEVELEANALVKSAVEALDSLPSNPFRNLLQAIAEYVLTRRI